MKLIVIGCGNMGSAIIKGLMKREEPLFEAIFACDHSPEKGKSIQETGALFVESLSGIDIDDETVVLIAVKPQNIEPALEQIKDKLCKGTLLLSVAAGVSIEKLSQLSGHDKIVRVMPNTPTLVQKGAAGWIASPTVTAEQKTLITSMLGRFGMAIQVENEDLINSVTALSGSGPAYVFYFLEALVEGGTSLGLSEEDALQLAIQTVSGAAELAKSSSSLDDLKNLRAKVTSKGGTTEKAISSLKEANFETLITKAMEAAYKRAQEL